MSGTGASRKLVSANRKARHEYEFIETFEAGLALTGSEVKSLRAGRVSWGDGYVDFKGDEAWLVGVNIAPYENAGYAQHDPVRPRKLLLHGHEIHLLRTRVEQKGLSVVPVALFLSRGRFKLDIALARGKKLHDKRDALRQRDLDREARRAMARD
ncbi:SsrA-binding protein [Desulfovibrio sp. X2]|uniref:SsrA-binding protein SmpB n=1 Tax=Desulfovibrio sp. X2 TaxID=941449 RepID=UPI000358933D|nr:SsrA-binding protein SmpB [Desulfovibrio sp. X2]EPR41685.1 SsrA-binding protein [Desulfovibrio sp. X2]